jgi:hypothetical protein
MTYRPGLCRRDKVLVTILAVIFFFLLYNECLERVTGRCAAWWNFMNGEDIYFTKR